MQKKSILILGVGSPFGADRLGWQAVQALEQQPLAAQFPQLDIRFEQSDRPGSRLLSLLRQVDAAVIIDAMRSGMSAGSVRRFENSALVGETGLMSTHGFGVAEALALGRTLAGVSGDDIAGDVVVIGIEMDAENVPEALREESLVELLALTQIELTRWGGDIC